MNCLAIEPAISLADAAASAGHRNARWGSCRPVGSYMVKLDAQTGRNALRQVKRPARPALRRTLEKSKEYAGRAYQAGAAICP